MCFEIAASKFLENYQKKVCDRVRFRVVRTKSKAYYQTTPQTHSGSVQKRKDILEL